jgi:hypothetical protein
MAIRDAISGGGTGGVVSNVGFLISLFVLASSLPSEWPPCARSI